jgi:glutamate-5-semialdehyde dehydrogenase
MVDSSCGDGPVSHILAEAKRARLTAPAIGDPAYPAFLAGLAHALRARWPEIAAANAADVAQVRARGAAPSIVDRVSLSETHLGQLQATIADVSAAIPTLGAAAALGTHGMTVRRIAKPIGVLLFVYEARPTVTIEGAIMPVAAGNAVLLRGGTEITRTNLAVSAVISDCLREAGLPTGMVQVLADGDRAQLRALLTCHDAIDLLIPRGSPSLIDYCRTASSIPMLASGGGVNHLYVHASADVDTAAAIALDSKLREPTACNTLEMVLVDEASAGGLVDALLARAQRLGVPFGLRLPATLMRSGTDLVAVEPLGPYDAGREFLSRTIALSVVSDVDGAVAHIGEHGSRHTEGIVAEELPAIEEFCARVDAAAIVVNGSLRLHDGPTMGLGPEISISTGRVHVRGPVGLTALVTYGWVIEGHGRLRDADAELALTPAMPV